MSTGCSSRQSVVLGIFSYVNCEPIRAVVESLLGSAVNIVRASPRKVGSMFVRRELDAATLPITYLLDESVGARVLDGLCIYSDVRTLSVGLFSKRHKSVRELPRSPVVVLTDESSVSAVIARHLLSSLGFEPRYHVMTIGDDLDDLLDKCDCALLIGDRALRALVRGYSQILDLGQAWRELTGRPIVYAVLAAREDVLEGSGHVVSKIVEILRRELRDVDRWIDRVVQSVSEYPRDLIESYFRHCIKYVMQEDLLRDLIGFELEVIRRSLGSDLSSRSCSLLQAREASRSP